MHVHAFGDPCGGVTQDAGHDFQRDALGEEQARGRVAQLVGCPVAEARPLRERREALPHVVGVERGADRGGEHEALFPPVLPGGETILALGVTQTSASASTSSES